MAALPFDPFRDKPRHSKKELDALFKGPGHILQRLKKENPSRYQELRAEYQQHGGVDAPGYTTAETKHRFQNPGIREFSEAELSAMHKYSREESRLFFRRRADEVSDLPIPGKLKHDNPTEYDERKLAAVAHGVLDRDPAVQVRDARHKSVQQPEAPRTMVLSDEIADFFDLPRGHVALESNALKLIAHKARLEHEKAAADATPKPDDKDEAA